MASKQVKQYALSHNTTYKIVDSWYSSILDGGATCCQNCGALIANVAIVENANAERFSVGMDCAETLGGVGGTYEFEYTHKDAFKAAKSFRAKLLNWDKKYISRTTDARNNGAFYSFVSRVQVRVNDAQMIATEFDKATAERYVLPMVKDLITQ